MCDSYLKIISDKGFVNISLQKEKQIIIPDDILSNYLSIDEIAAYRNSDSGIYSITVYAEKPKEAACCAPGKC